MAMMMSCVSLAGKCGAGICLKDVIRVMVRVRIKVMAGVGFDFGLQIIP